MKSRIILIAIAFFMGSCALPDQGEGDKVQDFQSKVIDFYTYLDENNAFLESVETRTYNSTGKPEKVFEHLFEQKDLSGTEYWENTRTNIYKIDAKTGLKTPQGYSKNTYKPILESEEQEDNTIVDKVVLYPLTIDNYDDAETRVSWNITEYADSNIPGEPTYYQARNKDYGEDHVESEQRFSYLKVAGPGYNKRRTFQTFNWVLIKDDPKTESVDETVNELKLATEYAYWYDDEGRVSHWLYHVVRGSDTDLGSIVTVLPQGVDERYIYTKFSYNAESQIYLQTDYIYDASDITSAADGSFPITLTDEPFAYNISHDRIGEIVSMQVNEYDTRGNLYQETNFIGSNKESVVLYRYDADDRLVEQSRFMNGGTLLNRKQVIRYRDEVIDGRYYELREEYTYDFSSEN